MKVVYIILIEKKNYFIKTGSILYSYYDDIENVAINNERKSKKSIRNELKE
mgnify:CR=1 FL=1